MNQKEFQKLTDDTFINCQFILNAKGADYSKADTDRLSNFKEVAALVGITPRQVLGVYMAKHMLSIFKWTTGATLSGEPIDAKFDDNINYSILGKALAEEENATKPQ